MKTPLPATLNIKGHILNPDTVLFVRVRRLCELLLDQPWHSKCDIITDYMPPYPSKDTKPSVQIRYNDGTEHPPFLRFSAGPKQGFFWDVCGGDFLDVELAVLALSKAPSPVNVNPVTIKFPLQEPKDEV
jgi:hypothetical protein